MAGNSPDWSNAEAAILDRAAAEGRTCAWAYETLQDAGFDRSIRAIRIYAWRRGLSLPKPGTWQPEQIAFVKKWTDARESAKQIAKRLCDEGIRPGTLPKSVTQLWHSRRDTDFKDRPRDIAPIRAHNAARKKAKRQRSQPVAIAEDPLTTEGILFDELRPNSCRWSIGRDVDTPRLYRFCGCETERINSFTFKSYCPPHYAISVGRPFFAEAAE